MKIARSGRVGGAPWVYVHLRKSINRLLLAQRNLLVLIDAQRNLPVLIDCCLVWRYGIYQY